MGSSPTSATMEEKEKVELLVFDSYLSVIKKSVDSKLFQTLWVKINGKKKDVTKNGRLSCAVFVSVVLHRFNLIKECHATVDGTIEDMKQSGWKKVRPPIGKPKIGAIIEWEEQEFDDGPHKHIGFYIGKDKAISNGLKKRVPIRHHWKYDGKRKILAIYWHPKLNK